jgi:hypothetical protein
MHNRFRLERADCRCKEVIVGYVADESLHRSAGQLLPNHQPLGQWPDWRQRLHSKFKVPLAAYKVVNDRNRVPFARKVKGCGPSTVSIATQNGNSHVFSQVVQIHRTKNIEGLDAIFGIRG